METERGGDKAGRQTEVEQWAKMLARRLLRKSNDVVKLAYLEGDTLSEQLDRLDLSLLNEFKRSANGAVEIKLIDRVKALGELAALLERSTPPEDDAAQARTQADSLYQALERRAGEQSYD
ncbi:MAG: XRE family transcriptional regulator [Oscillospiraceae bacterium]|nr:XRE family transcriptional regulator [Oscillospiraceae bacterium]